MCSKTHNTIASIMVQASRKLVEALKLHREPAYKLSWRIGLHPSTLSKLIHGAQPMQPDDARIIALGRELGLAPADCFARDESLPVSDEPKLTAVSA